MPGGRHRAAGGVPYRKAPILRSPAMASAGAERRQASGVLALPRRADLLRKNLHGAGGREGGEVRWSMPDFANRHTFAARAARGERLRDARPIRGRTERIEVRVRDRERYHGLYCFRRVPGRLGQRYSRATVRSKCRTDDAGAPTAVISTPRRWRLSRPPRAKYAGRSWWSAERIKPERLSRTRCRCCRPVQKSAVAEFGKLQPERAQGRTLYGYGGKHMRAPQRLTCARSRAPAAAALAKRTAWHRKRFFQRGRQRAKSRLYHAERF